MSDNRENFNTAAHHARRTSETDARLNAAQLGDWICQGRMDEAFAAAEKSEAGSQLPLLMAMAQDAITPNGTQDRLRARSPWLDFWYSHDFIVPLFDGTATSGDRWFENARMTPRERDDAFIIKAAIISAHADSMVPHLLDLGDVDLNTKNDRPVTLAVVLGKADLLPLLAESGADLFAAGAEAFKLARAQGSFDVYTELLSAAKNTQRVSQKKLMQRTPRGISPQDMRAGDDETGLHLAAKAGMVRLLAGQDILCSMTADDFLKPSKTGASAADILAAIGDYAALFDERIWGRRFDEAEKIFSSLDADAQTQGQNAYAQYMRGRDIGRGIDDLHKRWPQMKIPPKTSPGATGKGPKDTP